MTVDTVAIHCQSEGRKAVIDPQVSLELLDTNEPILNIPTARAHPSHASLTTAIDEYFLTKWPFSSSSAAEKWREEQHVLGTCYFYPFAIDDNRMNFACRLVVLLTLNDDRLDEVSLKDGSAGNKQLFNQMMYQSKADLTDPVANIAFDLFADMRANNPSAVTALVHGVHLFLDAQTNEDRLNIRSLADYFDYRLTDVGCTILINLLRYVMDFQLVETEKRQVSCLEDVVIRHFIIVNDIISYEKEVRVQESHPGVEGAQLCNAVDLLIRQCGGAVSIEGSKRILWALTREFETEYLRLANQIRTFSVQVNRYVRCLGYMMSGNAAWSLLSTRYH